MTIFQSVESLHANKSLKRKPCKDVLLLQASLNRANIILIGIMQKMPESSSVRTKTGTFIVKVASSFCMPNLASSVQEASRLGLEALLYYFFPPSLRTLIWGRQSSIVFGCRMWVGSLNLLTTQQIYCCALWIKSTEMSLGGAQEPRSIVSAWHHHVWLATREMATLFNQRLGKNKAWYIYFRACNVWRWDKRIWI